MDREIVYLNRDNTVDMILKSNDVAQDTSGFTRMDLKIGDVTVTSDNGDSDPIRWNKAGYAPGEVRLRLGDVESLEDGDYSAPLIVFDVENADGVVWGIIPLKITSDDELI